MNDISKVINELTGKGFVLISTDRQIKKGTLIFKDLFQVGVEYGIYGESGYVRKRYTSESPKTPARSMWYTDDRWWQLNKCINKPFKWGNETYYSKERILTPNDYKGMAKIIERVSMKSRMIYAKENLK